MAIEKVKTRKFELSKATVLQLTLAGVMAVLSLVLGYFSFVNWRFKVALVAGYEAYDTNQVTVAKRELEAALSWRPDHTGARELLAKIHCEGGALDLAKQEYDKLRAAGYNPPQVQIGMGAVYLRKADRAALPKDAAEAAAQAQREFATAGGVPEAEIGLGHCDLLLAQKLGDPKRIESARSTFAKIRRSIEDRHEYRAAITRDGLVDYYAGLGRALSLGETYDPGAPAAFRACYQYAPRWSVPLANILALEAQRFARGGEHALSNEALTKLDPETTQLRNEARVLWRTRGSVYEILKEPWLMCTLSVAAAWGRAGNLKREQDLLGEITAGGGFEQRPEPVLMDLRFKTDAAVRDDPSAPNQDKWVSTAMTSYENYIPKIVASDDAGKERRARALNNLAWMMAWRAGFTNYLAQYDRAIAQLAEALKLFPDDYVYNRNAAVVLKRFKRPAAAYQSYLDKAKAAAKGEWAQDWEKVQRFLESR